MTKSILIFMSDKKKGSDKPGILGSFIGGLVFTLVLVVVVPVVCNMFIQPIVEEHVGNTAFMWFSSSLIVTVVMLLVMFGFMIILGGSAILKKFGIVGVIALIAAYWLLGNIYGAILPVAVLIILFIVKRDRK